MTDGNGYRRPRIYAAAAVTAVLCTQSLAEIVVPGYDLPETAMLIELAAILVLLGLEAFDFLRGR